MRIENYFEQIHLTINDCPIIQSFNLAFDKRGSHEGFIHGEIYFLDGSCLHIREYIDVETSIDRIVYAYQYMASGGKMVFRYDNSGHHKKLNLKTYPHHKHIESGDTVVESNAPNLDHVLKEIISIIPLS